MIWLKGLGNYREPTIIFQRSLEEVKFCLGNTMFFQIIFKLNQCLRLAEIADDWQTDDVSGHLGHCNFKVDMIDRNVSLLTGGEKEQSLGQEYINGSKMMTRSTVGVANLERLVVVTIVPTLEVGENLVVTTAGGERWLAPMRINGCMLSLVSPNLVYDLMIVVHLRL
ncbi:hypothetical protein RHSIM_Rhsim06G0129600 [Rhododendron simsii]|uniref:Uncharacterized protein n=1 Tax=Rhododendron simsii TaxID=118357 RepID=A0A834GW43_RHOSS|nr:hypothetical protein RHSIM_Rhsim06G0129600 [Rhododendron simsii]